MTEPPAPTRDRIVAAAVAEFAEHGLAGARVDRVAAAAQINKAQLYAHVGNKEQLFDAAFTEHVDRFVSAVPLTPDDLPGYAARLYDAYLADPTLIRLVTWARLERRPTGDLFADSPGHDERKLAALRDAQAAGRIVDDVEIQDLWALLVAMAATWAQAAVVVTATTSDPDDDHARRRTALAATVGRAFVPAP